MKTMGRRILSFLLIIVMVMSLIQLPVSTVAANVALDEYLNAANYSQGSMDTNIAQGVSDVVVQEKDIESGTKEEITKDISVEETEQINNRFCLVAEDENQLIIEPEWVYYDKEETVKSALVKTGHIFDGIEQGFIYGINGVIYTPFVTSDNSVYALEEEASEIANVFRFSTTSDLPSSGLVALLSAMADYNEMQEYRDSDDITVLYNEAKDAYIGIDSQTAQSYADKLRAEMRKIDEAEKYKVEFDIEQNGENVTLFETVIRNEKGTVMKPEADGTYRLMSGNYTAEISKAYNAVCGSFTVGEEDYTVAAELPSGHQIENAFFFSQGASTSKEYSSNTANRKMSVDFSPSQHEYTVYVPDTEITIYMLRNNSSAWSALKNQGYYLYYTTLNGTHKDNKGYYGTGCDMSSAMGGALVVGGVKVISEYGAGCKAVATHEVECENGFTQIQSYYINFVRIRTMKSVEVKDENGAVAVINEHSVYTATVLDTTDTVTLWPKSNGAYSDGYCITVNGAECEENGGVEVALTGDTTEVPVSISHTDGTRNNYTVVINREAAYRSVVTLETGGADVAITNSQGTEIIPDKVEGNVYTYGLIPNETYICTASKNANRTICTFTADETTEYAHNIIISVLEANNWLSDLAFGTLTTAPYKGNLEMSSDFESINHEYTVTIPESTTGPSIWATINATAEFPATTKTITVCYEKQPTSISGSAVPTEIAVTSGKNTGTKITNLHTTRQPAEQFEVQVACTSGNFTYMQVYTINPMVYPQLSALAVEADGTTLATDPVKFSADTKTYTVTVSELTKNFTVNAKIYRSFNSLKINGIDAASGEDVIAAMSDIKDNKIPVTAVSKDGKVENTYTIEINVLPALDVTITATPEDAIVFITDMNGKRVNKEDNTYKMLAGATYNYTVSCAGYITQTGTYTVSENGEGFSITLEKASDNENINKELNAAWPMFRGDNTNNGIITTKTPKSADEATLYWATKDGKGYDSNAIGCPIIVNEYLVYCTGNELHRMNRFTGEIDKNTVGTMVGKSSFNIIPPTYAEGMIFVALANGTVQAFNAETFESLWVYKDALGGQPNSPIVYQDGYVYTGFWVGETGKANFVCLSATDEDTTSTEEKNASWTYTQLGGFYWAGAYACEDFILVGTDDGASGYLSDTSNFLSFDTKTGKLLDKIENLNGDIRSSVSYDEVTERYYFTTKGGSFYSVAVNKDGTFVKDENGVQGYDLKEIELYNYSEDTVNPAMSTCTPVVYNGRAYIGVSGTSQFGAYSGHNITVIDLADWKIAYTIRTKGYPQTSGLLTSAYESEDEYAYIYFIDNYTPGQVRVIKDKPGVTEVVDGVKESYMSHGQIVTLTCAPVLFTPAAEQAQYAICSPISDEYGTLYFKNDSAYMMAVGSRIESIEVTEQPDKTVYLEEEPFDLVGVKVVAHFANGLSRDITDEVTLNESADSLSSQDTDVTIYYNTVMYGDRFDSENGNEVGIEVISPETYVSVMVLTKEQAADLSNTIELINGIGEVTLDSADVIGAARGAFEKLDFDVQDLVSNLEILDNAEAEYNTIKDVYAMISAIGEVTYAKKDAVDSAVNAYETLSKEQKNKITNAEVLTTAETILAELKDDVEKVEELISAIGTVTIDSETALRTAREAYDALPEESKPVVSNYTVLVTAEKTFTEISAVGNDEATTTVSSTTEKETTTVKIKVGKAKVKQATKNKASKKAKLILSKVKYAKGYQIAIYKTKTNAKKNKKAIVKKMVKKTKVNINSNKLKNKKKLYVRVRAYKIVNGKKYFGKWGKVKKITIK